VSGKMDFLPVILGSDDNAYGMARSFHEEYGIKSIVITKGHLLPTAHSKIIEKRMVPGFDDIENFVCKLKSLAPELKERANKLLLIASNENYAELCIRNRAALENDYIVPFISEDLMEKVVYKENFYEMCEGYGLDYPATIIFKKGMDPQMDLPFDFPVVVKASDSMTYFNAQFPGKKKAYIINNKKDFTEAINNIYSSTYEDNLIIQDYIPGDDTVMHVLNAYVDRNHKVRMMCLGRIVLEDHTPVLIGNYVGIVSEYNKEIYDKYQKFLEDVKFTGYANIDLKYDRRDGKMKIFELNIRQGRSSFFVTASGYNLAKYLVNDRIYEKDFPVEYGDKEYLWHSIPQDLLLKYTMDDELKEQVKRLIKEKKTATTLYYKKDRNIIRTLKLNNYYKDYYTRYEKYFIKKD